MSDKCFQILGLRPSAMESEIKAAYRKLAMANHPDRGGSTEKMKAINAAYEQCMRIIQYSPEESFPPRGGRPYESDQGFRDQGFRDKRFGDQGLRDQGFPRDHGFPRDQGFHQPGRGMGGSPWERHHEDRGGQGRARQRDGGDGDWDRDRENEEWLKEQGRKEQGRARTKAQRARAEACGGGRAAECCETEEWLNEQTGAYAKARGGKNGGNSSLEQELYDAKTEEKLYADAYSTAKAEIQRMEQKLDAMKQEAEATRKTWRNSQVNVQNLEARCKAKHGR